jgi:DNA repair photolyase
MYKSPIKLAGGEESFVCPQSLVLNSYLGCSHGCVYCYAKFVLDIYHDFSGSSIPADPSLVEKAMVKAFKKNGKDAISQLIRSKVPFRFSNLTDPFQECEREHKATYNILKILSKWQYPAILNTKGIICADDEYIEVLKDIPCVIQMTITTDSDDIASKIEPYAPLPSERLQALDKLSKSGIITQVRYSPVFPKLTDEPDNLFKLCSNNGCRDIVCEMVRLPFTHKYLDSLNAGLGYDYLASLKGYPIIKAKHWWKVEPIHKFNEYRRFKAIAANHGMKFYVCCEEEPEINGYANCCGTDKYPGMKSCMPWTMQMRGNVFRGDKINFDEYIKDTGCPYQEDFAKYWQSGKLEGTMSHLRYVKDDNTYIRKEKKACTLENFQ